MKLITHNLLVCNRKACQAAGVVNFPLKLQCAKWEDYDDQSAMPMTKPIMTKVTEKLDWPALCQTVSALDWGIELPQQFEQEMLEDQQFMTQLHLLLLKRQVVEGVLQCPNCDRQYEIKSGIPNMLLNEDEV